MTVVQPITAPQPVKFTVEQFDLLARSGALDGFSKTELIEGAIYEMSPQLIAHGYAKTQLTIRLGIAAAVHPSGLAVMSETTVAMPPSNAPEPDISLAHVQPGTRSFIPLESVALVVEVSDSSAAFDLGDKAKLYARNRVPEYWVLEIPTATLHQMWLPKGEGYTQRRTFPLGTRVESVTIAGLAVETAGLI